MIECKTEWRLEMRRRLKVITADVAPKTRLEREERLSVALSRVVGARPGLWLSFSPLSEEPRLALTCPRVTFAYPRMESRSQASHALMSFFTSNDEAAAWTAHPTGVREPDPKDARWSAVDMRLSNAIRGALIPGLGFDRRLRRLGRGAGFYDRFLVGSTFTKVGVGFSEQVEDEIPSEPHDIGLDALVTDREVIWNMTSSSI